MGEQFDGLQGTQSFGAAIAHLKSGLYARREGWNGKGMWVGLQVPDPDSKMSLPYTYICTVDGDLVPWVASVSDQLADDWVLLNDHGEPV